MIEAALYNATCPKCSDDLTTTFTTETYIGSFDIPIHENAYCLDCDTEYQIPDGSHLKLIVGKKS